MFFFRSSLAQTCSQLIKAGLKLSLEMKRKLSSGGDSSGTENTKIAKMEFPDSSDEDDDDMDLMSPSCGVRARLICPIFRKY